MTAELYIVAAQLKAGTAAEAERELAAGPPFDPAGFGLSRHAAYAATDAVYLLFEGTDARGTAVKLAREHLVDVSRWQSIVIGLPHMVSEIPPEARCLYQWHAGRQA